MLSEVTESEAALVVPIHRQSIIGDVYKDFKTGKWDAFDALESLESGILAEGYSFSNIEINPDDFKAGTFSSGEHQRLRDRFESAQSRVLDRSRCLLLGREG